MLRGFCMPRFDRRRTMLSSMSADLGNLNPQDIPHPRQTLLERALRLHSRADHIGQLRAERNVDGDLAWGIGYLEQDGWLEWWLRPSRPDDPRAPIRIGGVPLDDVERMEANWRALLESDSDAA
jgi:hypothetical protein